MNGLLPSFLLTFRPTVELDSRAKYCTCQLPSGAIHSFTVANPDKLRSFCQERGITLREINTQSSFAVGEASNPPRKAGGGGQEWTKVG